MEFGIEKVTTRRDLQRFVDFPSELYQNSENYTPYVKADLKKTLSRLIFCAKTYRALYVAGADGRTLGTVLYTVAPNKQLKTERCGFFSHFECVDDPAVSAALLFEMERELREMGAEYASGSYFPHDPDNRRGILVDGFTTPPPILTSFNPPYFGERLEAAGYVKGADTLSFHPPPPRTATVP